MEHIDEALKNGDELKAHLGGNTYCTVSKDSECVDVRQYWIPPDKPDIVPTTKGLRPQENCTVSKDSTCVDIRQYWIPPDKPHIVPTTKAIGLRPQENCRLKEFITDIENILPHLSTIILCLFEDDHINQMGMLKCSECNPNSFIEY